MSNNNKKRDNFNYYLTDDDFEQFYPDNVTELIEEYKMLRDKYIKIGQRLADRVDIERAKDIIRDKRQADGKLCDGDSAMRALKKLACKQNITLGQAAKQIIATREVIMEIA